MHDSKREPLVAISPAILAERHGNTPRWWRERIPLLRDAGVAHRVGRSTFARLTDIDSWLAGELTETG